MTRRFIARSFRFDASLHFLPLPANRKTLGDVECRISSPGAESQRLM